MPAMKFTGLETAAQTVLTASRSGSPGAINTSAPAASYARRRMITASRSGCPRRKHSHRAVRTKSKPVERAAATAARTLAVALLTSWIGRSDSPVASSMEQPTSPTSHATNLPHWPQHRPSADPNGFRHRGGIMPKAVFEIGGNGQFYRVHDGLCVPECIVAQDVPITSADRSGEPATRCRQRQETQTFQNSRRTCIERVSDDKRLAAPVQCTKSRGLFDLPNPETVCLPFTVLFQLGILTDYHRIARK